MRRPGRTVDRQARTRLMTGVSESTDSSTVTIQSKQTPMLQNGPLGFPAASRVMAKTSAAIKAVASDSPSYAVTARPLTKMLTGGGLAMFFVMRWLTVRRMP